MAASGDAFAVANGVGEPGVAGADAAGVSGKSVVLRGGPKTWSIIRRCCAVSSEHWPMARWRPSTIARDKEPTITPEAKAWLVSLACDKAKDHGLMSLSACRNEEAPHEHLTVGDWRPNQRVFSSVRMSSCETGRSAPGPHQ